MIFADIQSNHISHWQLAIERNTHKHAFSAHTSHIRYSTLITTYFQQLTQFPLFAEWKFIVSWTPWAYCQSIFSLSLFISISYFSIFYSHFIYSNLFSYILAVCLLLVFFFAHIKNRERANDLWLLYVLPIKPNKLVQLREFVGALLWRPHTQMRH